jgi:hypothetical protein
VQDQDRGDAGPEPRWHATETIALRAPGQQSLFEVSRDVSFTKGNIDGIRPGYQADPSPMALRRSCDLA